MKMDELTKIDKQKLTTAYMRLYDALVSQCQSKNMSYGESWHRALCEMENILAKNKKCGNVLVMNYVTALHKANKKAQSKKSMTAMNKDVRIESVDKTAVTNGLRSAIDEFEHLINSITAPDVLVTIKPAPNVPTYAGTFWDWAGTLSDEQIEALEKNPKEFARQYRHFVLSRRVKAK